MEQYSIRISSRAKYMRLSLSLDKGLIVVIPESMNQFQAQQMIPAFVKQQHSWITRSIKKLTEKKKLRSINEACALPEKIQLTALEQVFIVDYINLPDASIILNYTDKQQLMIRGQLDNKKAVFACLQKYFKQYARSYLQQRLDELSEQLKIPYNRLTVRAQKTRWGSCSSKKNINLNYKLIFIDKSLLDYVLIHELLHIIHMNHSKAYWSDLALIMPDARTIDKQLNQVTKEMPCWM